MSNVTFTRRLSRACPLLRACGIALVACTTGLVTSLAHAVTPITTCDAAGIGSVTLFGDGPPVTILSATPAVTAAPA